MQKMPLYMAFIDGSREHETVIEATILPEILN